MLRVETCVACRKDSPRVTEAELAELRPQIPEWSIEERDDVPRLERVFKFKSYAQSVAFANRVAEMAEAQHHHPAIVLEWGRVTVTWWTHAIGGLHRNDFIMAAKTDELFGEK